MMKIKSSKPTLEVKRLCLSSSPVRVITLTQCQALAAVDRFTPEKILYEAQFTINSRPNKKDTAIKTWSEINKLSNLSE